MDWAKEGTGNRNPEVNIDDSKGTSLIKKAPTKGTKVTLDASKSQDPDDDKLTFKWWPLTEAGTYTAIINIADNDSSRATIDVPADSAGKSFHVICEVTDNGTHPLSSYRRIIFEPTN